MAKLRAGRPDSSAEAPRTNRRYYDILCGMEKIRPILYGVADYAEIRKANAWFVDRTANRTLGDRPFGAVPLSLRRVI